MKLGNREFFVSFNGLEPVFTTIKYEPRGTTTKTFALLYPIRRTIHVLKFKYLKLTVKDFKDCQMCGEWIAETTMEDPNYDSDKILNVCNSCVGWVGEKQMESFTTFMDIQKKKLEDEKKAEDSKFKSMVS